MICRRRFSFMILRKAAILLIFISTTLFSGCGDHFATDKIPFAYVSEDINLTNVQYANLHNDGGWVYFDGSGYRGLIIYHVSGDDYRVFERACPYDPRSDCDPVQVDDSGLFMIHKCCKSTFYFDGQPYGGPAELPLRQYNTYVDGNFLLIRSD